MPDDAIKNVIRWAVANPEFVIKIWVDPITDPAVVRKYQTKLQEWDESEKIKNIEITDINQPGICTEEIRYEIDHLSPNYGASSDMLRYNILFKEGGAYFDCGDVFSNDRVRLGDIDFGDEDPDKGKHVFDTVLSGPRLLLHVTPHVMHDPTKPDKREAPGTEAIICTPGNPLMQGIAERAHAAYHGTNWNYKLLQYEYNFGLQGVNSPPMGSKRRSRVTQLREVMDRRNSPTHSLFVNERAQISDQQDITKRRALDTLNLTGPLMAVTYLQQTLGLEKLSQQYLMPQTDQKAHDWVSLPKEHALAWAPFRVLPHNFLDAIASAVDSINFEVNEMNIFNFSAHVEQITCAVENARKAGMQTGVAYKDISELKTQVNNALFSEFSSDNRFQVAGDTLIKRTSLVSKNVKIK